MGWCWCSYCSWEDVGAIPTLMPLWILLKWKGNPKRGLRRTGGSRAGSPPGFLGGKHGSIPGLQAESPDFLFSTSLPISARSFWISIKKASWTTTSIPIADSPPVHSFLPERRVGCFSVRLPVGSATGEDSKPNRLMREET